MAELRYLGACPRDSRMQVGSRVAGRGRLSGVLLGVAQLGDGDGQGNELGHERDGHKRVVAGEVPRQCDHPSGVPQLVTFMAAPGNAPVLGPGGTVVGVGRVPQVRVTQRP